MKRPSRRTILGCASAAVLLAGCQTLDENLPDRRLDYRNSERTGNLEVPPDLTFTAETGPSAGAGGATYSAYEGTLSENPGGAESVLQETAEEVRLERDGAQRWLVVEAPPEQVWRQVRDFWESQDIPLQREDPTLGIMETEWLENRVDVPEGFIRAAISRAFGSSYAKPTRDRYRVRLERGREPGTTEIYLSHYKVEKVEEKDRSDRRRFLWEPRDSDPELQAEMRKRLMAYLSGGTVETTADAAEAGSASAPSVQIRNDGGGNPYLVIGRDYAQSWRLLARAVDRLGLPIQERDNSAGWMEVAFEDPEAAEESSGWLSKLAFWNQGDSEAERYVLQLSAPQAQQSVVTVIDLAGEPAPATDARRLLELLQAQMR